MAWNYIKDNEFHPRRMQSIQKYWDTNIGKYRGSVLDTLSTHCSKILSQQTEVSTRQTDIFMTRKRQNADSHFQEVLEDLNIPDIAHAPKFQAFLKDCYDVGLNLNDVWVNVQQQQLKFYANMLTLMRISPTVTTQLVDVLTPQEVFEPFKNFVVEIQSLKRKYDQLDKKLDGVAATVHTINENVNTLTTFLIANKP